MEIKYPKPQVRRKKTKFNRDISRVITRLHVPENSRTPKIINRVVNLNENEAEKLMERIHFEFFDRHRDITRVLKEHFDAVAEYIPQGEELSETKKMHSSKSLKHVLCTVFALLSLVTSFNASALGQLMVAPTRVVFEGNERTQQINIINNGSEAGRYRITFVRRDMSSEGKIEVIDENKPGMYSDEMVRFSPRQVTLEPGQSQIVRLMLRKKRGTTDGEYRSHMMFQSLPDPGATDVNELSTNKEASFSIKLIPVVGITIPVIVRQGKLNADVSLSGFEIKQSNTVKAQSVLALTINRSGDKSVYGDFRVYFTPKGSAPMVIGQINGVAVYTPLASRSVEIRLQTPAGFNLSNGEFHITYLEAGKNEITGLLAESRFAVP